MQSNEDFVQKILKKMEGDNPSQAMIEGLRIFTKLVNNIVQNPFEPKYRHVKVSNNTIKSKLMNLKGIDELLKQLGYVRENQQIYTLRDEQVGDFLQGSPPIDYQLRLLEARQRSQADYDKELLLIQVHRQQRQEEARRKQQSRRLKEKCEYDKMQRKHMQVDSSKSNDLKFGTKTTSWKDIGVDLCAKNKG